MSGRALVAALATFVPRFGAKGAPVRPAAGRDGGSLDHKSPA